MPWFASLSVVDSTTMRLRTENGATFDFTYASSGNYTSPFLAHSRLKKLADGTFTLTTPDFFVLSFNTAGQLTAVRDPAGQGLALTYTGTELTSVTDAAGRTATLTYGGGRLTMVTLPDGRYVQYAYTDGRLTGVRALDGKTTSYGYDPAGRLDTVRDPLGRVLTHNTYDAQGRVIEQIDSDGGTTSFVYSPGRTDATLPDGGIWTDIYGDGILLASYDPLGNKTTYRYDAYYNPVQIVDALGNRTSYTYDTQGRPLTRTAPAPMSYKQTWAYTGGNLTSYTDGRGKVTAFTYNSQHRLLTVEDPLHASTAFTYTARGQLETVTTPRGKKTVFEYDAAGNQISVTSPSGAKTTRTYDPAGRVTSETNPRGNVTGATPAKFTVGYVYDDADRLRYVDQPDGGRIQLAYDEVGNLHTVTDPLTKVTTFGFNTAKRLTSIIDAEQAETTIGYDTSGRVTNWVDATGAKTSYGYDKANRLISLTTPRGNVAGVDPVDYTWTFGYDNLHRLESVTDPTGATTATTYDALGRTATRTDPLGKRYSASYDGADNLTTVTDPYAKVTSLGYDDAGQLTTVTDPLRRSTTIGYDADGHQISVRLPSGATTTATYDDDGRQDTLVDPRGNASGANPADYTWRYGYDADGNMTSVTDPVGHSVSAEYTWSGQGATVTNQLGATISYEYDLADQLKKVIAPDGGNTTYGYDDVGNITSRTDHNGHTTSFEHDAVGRLKTETDPLGKAVSYTYDKDGNRDTVTNRRGQTISTSYDAVNRPTQVTFSDGTPAISYEYTAAGQLKSLTGPTGTQDLTWDDAGRLKTVGGASGFRYDYDDAGQLTTRTYPSGTSMALTYTLDGLLRTQTVGGASTTFDYDQAGRLISTALPTANGYTETRAYDRAGRLESVASTHPTKGTLAHWAMTRDNAGQPTRIDVNRAGQPSVARIFGYDEAGRVESECQAPADGECTDPTNYTYDKVGNRLTRTAGGASTTYTYDAANQLVSATSGGNTETFGYDADGNQTSSAGRTYGYDAANRLTTVRGASAQADYTYDAAGNLAAVDLGSGTRTYSWDVNHALPMLATTGGVDLGYDPLGQPLWERDSTATDYLHHDWLGSVTDRTAADGAAQYRLGYDAFGQSVESGPVGGGAAADRPVLGFTGALTTPDGTAAGVGIHLRARTYDPTTGRFLTRDPARRGAPSPATSEYGYVDNRTTTLTDPSGLCPPCAVILGRVAIGAAIGSGINAASYTLTHAGTDDWSWRDFGMTVAEGAFTGGIGGLIMPGAGNGAVRMLGVQGAKAMLVRYSVNAVAGAGFSWAVNSALCRPTTPTDLLLGGLFSGLASGPRSVGLQRVRGTGAGPNQPMNMTSVRSIAAKYGIDISDIRFEINKSRRGIHGTTRPDCTVILCRDAFRSEEDLARTLAHEKFHVDELRSGKPYPRTMDEAGPFEDRAYEFEEIWWANHPIRPDGVTR